METKNFRGANGLMKPAVFYIMLCSMIYIYIQAAVGDLIVEPENTVALFNATVTFQCKSDGQDEKLRWTMRANNSEEVELWSGYYPNSNACPCSPCCQVDNTEPGRYNLKITARKETANRFICTEPGTLTRATADLIVIASNLTCNYTATARDVRLSCVLGVYGEWSLQIKWRNSYGVQMNKTSDSAENGQVASTLITPLTSYKTSFTAYAYLSETDRPAEVTAKNIPSIGLYVVEWTSPSFQLSELETKEESTTDYIRSIAVVCVFVACVLVVATIILIGCWKRIFSNAKGGSVSGDNAIQEIMLCDGVTKKGNNQKV